MFFFAFAITAQAQSTTVSGTVTDLGAQTWNNGTYTFQFIPNPDYPNPGSYTWTGGTLAQSIHGTLSGSGTYSQSIPSNSSISPQGSSWALTVCPQATSPCYTLNPVTVTGGTQTLNATPPAIAINLLIPGSSYRAYADAEITSAVVASQYYNLTSQQLRICQTVSGNTCTAWANVGGGGGGGTPGGADTDVQVNCSGTFCGSDNFTFDPVAQNLSIDLGANGAAVISGGATLGTGITIDGAALNPPQVQVSATDTGGQIILTANNSIFLQQNSITGLLLAGGLLQAPIGVTFPGSTSGSAAIGVPAVAGTPSEILLPTATGANGNCFKTNGGTPQQTSWGACGSSQVTALYTVGTTAGTTANGVVNFDSSNNVIGAQATLFTGASTFGGVAQATVAPTGTVNVALTGTWPVLMDGAYVNNDIAVVSVTNPQECHDSGQMNAAILPDSMAICGVIVSPSGSASTANITLAPPGTYGPGNHCIDVEPTTGSVSGTDLGTLMARALTLAQSLYPIGACIDVGNGQKTNGAIIYSSVAFRTVNSGNVWSNYSTVVRFHGQKVDLETQYVQPQKSLIEGANPVSGQSNNTELYADGNFVTAAQGCTISIAAGVATVTGCTSFSSQGGTANAFQPTIQASNFVIISQTGTNTPLGFGTDSLLGSKEVQSSTTATGTSASFTFNYTGAQTPSGTYNVTIPVLWWGSQTGTSSGVDDGSILSRIAVSCSDAPNSVGIFSDTVNEGSRRSDIWIRQCTAYNGLIMADPGGTPQNAGPDLITSDGMSNNTPTSGNTLLLGLPPAADVVIQNNGPWRGIDGITMRQASTPNPVLNGIMLIGVFGAHIQNAHAEIQNTVLYLAKPTGYSVVNRAIVGDVLTTGVGGYPYTGTGTDNCGFSYTTVSGTAGLYGPIVLIDPGASIASSFTGISANNDHCSISDGTTSRDVTHTNPVADTTVSQYIEGPGSSPNAIYDLMGNASNVTSINGVFMPTSAFAIATNSTGQPILATNVASLGANTFTGTQVIPTATITNATCSGTCSGFNSGASGNWNGLGNPTGNLTLTMASDLTAFQYATGLSNAFVWQNTTAAISGTNQNGPVICPSEGTEYSGSASVTESLCEQTVVGTGNNAVITNTWTGTGSTGTHQWVFNAASTAASGITQFRLQKSGTNAIQIEDDGTASYFEGSLEGVNKVTALVTNGGQAWTNTTHPMFSVGQLSTVTGMSATSGTMVGFGAGGDTTYGEFLFNPTSGTANFIASLIEANINQTSTATGNATLMGGYELNTAFLGTNNYLLALGTTSALGPSGTLTNKFTVDVSGNTTATSIKFPGSTSGSATIGVAATAGTPNEILLPTTTGGASTCLQTNGANPQQTSWASCGSGGSSALSAITAATAANTLANGNNGLQIWNWAPTTNQNQFQFGETTAATNGTLGSQYLLSSVTLAGSTAVPLGVISSLTGSQTLPTLHISPTWNTSGVVDAALLVNVTNTASGTGSKLLDLQIGGTSEANVDKAGNLNIAGSLSTGTAPACTAGSGSSACLTEGTAPTNASGADAIYADSTAHELKAATAGSSSYGILLRAQPGAIRSTGLTGAVSTATLCAASAGACNVAGTYHVHFALYQSGTACTANTTGGVSPSLTWTDANGTTHSAIGIPLFSDGVVNAITGTMLWGATTVSGIASGDFNIDTNGTVIQYAVAFAQCNTGTATYAISAVVDRLQ